MPQRAKAISMLKHFTWPQFLIAALILSSIWYLVVLPLLYRRQLRDWLVSFRRKPDVRPLGREWEEELEDEAGSGEEPDDLMGKSRLPEGVSRVPMGSFGFAPEVAEDDGRDRLLGLVPDALEELKSIFLVLEREGGNKADFIALFGLVRAKYAALAGTPSETALNDYIRENALFPISDDELMHLWN